MEERAESQQGRGAAGRRSGRGERLCALQCLEVHPCKRNGAALQCPLLWGGRLLRLYVRNAVPSTHKALVLLSRMENTSVFTRERFAVFKEAYCFSSA